MLGSKGKEIRQGPARRGAPLARVVRAGWTAMSSTARSGCDCATRARGVAGRSPVMSQPSTGRTDARTRAHAHAHTHTHSTCARVQAHANARAPLQAFAHARPHAHARARA
eukprot:8455065-Alexandrium_andersonii.AAC.1